MIYVILAIAALLTSALSAVTGLGGGILMLAVILAFLDMWEAVPLHAAIQLSSNATRVAVFLREVDWRAMWWFIFGLVPGGAIGTFLLWRVGRLGDSEPYLKIIVGVYVLVATFLPKPQKVKTVEGTTQFLVTGFVAGTLALLLGAIGPLIAPVIARAGYDKQRTIATQAVCQMLAHVVKFPAYLLGVGDQISMQRLGILAVVCMIMTIPGTLYGRSLLHKVTPRTFNILFRGALFIAGTKVLFYDGIWALVKPVA